MAFTGFAEAMFPFPDAERARLLELGDRIVFGSDFPNIPYRYSEAIQALIDLDLGDRWLSGVLYRNGRRLFPA
jgi:predicted TIM-barrel fold metal-dependent hydrolase